VYTSRALTQVQRKLVKIMAKDITAATRAKNKYRDKAYDQINIVVPKGKKAALQEHATGMGESLNGFVNRAIDETVGRDTTVVPVSHEDKQEHGTNDFQPWHEALPTNTGKLCPMCNIPMTQLRSTKTYCSSSCRAKAHKKRKSNEVDQMDLLD